MPGVPVEEGSYFDHTLERIGLFTLYFQTYFHCVQAKAMSDNTNVVALGLFAYPVLQAADILLYK